MKVKNKYILVKEDEESENKQQDRVFMDFTKPTNKGKVIEAEDSNLVGATIYFSNAFTKMKIEDQDVIVMKEENIIVVI